MLKYFLISTFLILHNGWGQSELGQRAAESANDVSKTVEELTSPPEASYCSTGEDEYRTYKKKLKKRNYGGYGAKRKRISFCDDPYGAICGDQYSKARSDQKLISEIRTIIQADIFADALKAVKKDIKGMDQSELQKLITKLLSDQRVFSLIASRTNQFIASVTEKGDIESNYAEVVSLMKKGLDQSGADSSTQYGLLNQIGQVKIISPNKLLEHIKKSKSNWNSVYKLYIKGCGADGLRPSAFYISEGRYVVLCPGFLLVTRGTGLTLKKSIDSLVHVLSHEIAHDFSSKRPGKSSMYDRYRYCIKKYYLEGSQGDSYLSDRLNEITADFWAVQTVANYLEKMSKEPYSSDSLKYYTLQDAFGFLCGSRDSGEHPSDRFRIEKLLRRDPRIHEAMGCKVDTGKKEFGCNLAGPVKLN